MTRLNQEFVCTSIIIDDLKKRAESSDPLAKLLVSEWVYPLEMFFLTPSGALVSKLNSFADFPGMHPDVAAPPRRRHQVMKNEDSHKDVFVNHLALHFGKE
jgi:hypothetical protein